VKAAKRKLHQIFAAYCPPEAMTRLGEQVAGLPNPNDETALRESCREILLGHASSAERLSFLPEIYPALWQRTGKPGVLLDLACGFHPFALPWMDLDRTAEYHPSDIDSRLITEVNRFLTHLGRPATARCVDLLSDTPGVLADCALLLKTLPILEQQEKGISPRIIRAIPARYIVVSFPTESLGGLRKGMREHYRQVISRVAEEVAVSMTELPFPTETFYILKKGDLHSAAAGVFV
jgi:16S rRNA (guanine(1405)-N(7))-methyltransferase